MGKRGLAVCLVAIALVAGLASGCGGKSRGPLRIGVMLPLTGREAVGAEGPLEWARENVNAAGGVDGRPIEFVYRDLGRENAQAVARGLASDASIDAVIGPANSEDAKQVASAFVSHDKVIVTPSATSGDLFRAFFSHRPQYLWRPVESDVAQVRVMLELAAQRRAKNVALVAGYSPYGNTFFNSFGFLATEKGLRVTATIRFREDQSCKDPLDQALGSGADVVLAVSQHDAACMVREWRARGSRPRLLLSDSAQEPSLISALGPAARGVEGTGLAPDPHTGFAQAFEARFHKLPTPYAANLYDSVLLVAYGLARSVETHPVRPQAYTGAALANAIRAVVDGEGQATGWDRAGVAQQLAAIRAGRLPAVHGAVGPWDFDKTSGIELVGSTYEHWRVRHGQFVPVRYISTATSTTAKRGTSAFKTPTTPGKGPNDVGGTYHPGRHTGTWALLVAGSNGWDNYRHQADVLAQYQRLRAGGLAADHILVVSPNDLAHSEQNPDPGTVRYAVGGPNLYRGFHVDYPLEGMTAERLMNLLSGRASPGTRKVIRSGPGDNVFVYLAGHGNHNGFYLGLGQGVPSQDGSYSILTPELLNRTLSTMADKRRYRRIVVAVESCQGGVFGEGLDAPGALVLSAANPVENSLGTNYDAKLRTWLADEFSYQLWKAEAAKRPHASMYQLYQHLYLHVAGSHVSAYGPRFGNAATVPIREFVTP